MSDEKINGSPILEETFYDSSSAKKNNSLEGMTAPVLDDMDYSAPTEKKGGPMGVSAPVLDDMDFGSYQSTEKKGDPMGVSAPVLDDMQDYVPQQNKTTPKSDTESPYIDDDTIINGFSPEQREQFDKLAPEKQKVVIDFRRKQLSQNQSPAQSEPDIKAPVLDEDNYVPPVKEKKSDDTYEEPLKAPVLDEAPETPEYVPKFVDQDLEKIKREAAKESVKSQLSSNQKDEKESLRMMQQLREEREQRDAKQGFKLTIIVAVIGVIAAVLFVLFASGDYFGLSYKEGTGNKLREIVSQYSVYIGVFVGICSLLLITGFKFIKGFITTVFLLFTVILVFPGIVMLMQKDGSMALNVILYALSVAGSGYTFFSLTGNDKIGLFFSKKY